MKFVLIPFLLWFSGALFAQSHTFYPNWKKGDTYQVLIQTNKKTWNDGEPTEEDYYLDPVIEVSEVTSDSYFLKVRFNDTFSYAYRKIEAKYGYTPIPFFLELDYEINRENGDFQLKNLSEAYAEVKANVNNLRQNLKDFILGYDSRDSSQSGQHMNLQNYEKYLRADSIDDFIEYKLRLRLSENLISQLFQPTLEAMLNVYYTPFIAGDTIISQIETDNSNHGEVISKKVLNSYSPDSGIAKIWESKTLDSEAREALFEPLFRRALTKMEGIDSTSTHEEVEAAQLKVEPMVAAIEIKNVSEIYYQLNRESTWPIEIYTITRAASIMEPIQSSRTETKTRITLSYR